MKAEELKEKIIETWKKNRIPSFIKSISEVYENLYDKSSREVYLIALIPPYLIDIIYSKRYMYCHIDYLDEKALNFARELVRLKEFVLDIDENAFITLSTVKDVFGKGFKRVK